MRPEISVVIPTRDGGDRVLEVLRALDHQVGAPPFEVVVVDDGSHDGSVERVRALTAAIEVRVLELEPSGPAAARNRGVRAAVGERVAFLGDDTVPAPDWLASHSAGWRRRGGGDEIALIGYTAWHPRLRPSRFLRFLDEEGLQFGYGLIRDPEAVPFNFFYTSNLSVSRRLLLAEPFDESFPYAAWEDIEAGYRLVRRGVRLAYEPNAVARHDHATDFERFCTRQERSGYCAVVFWRLHPELAEFLGLSESGPPPLPSRAGQWLREALVRALQPFPLPMRRLWSEALRFHYVRGLHRGWRDRVVEGGGGT
jgi:glycosyltransferase involved in cell wall biosynthesis